MLKRYCDRCGKELDGEYFQIEIAAKTQGSSIPTLFTAACNMSEAYRPVPDYCEECAGEFRRFLEKK